MNLILKLLINEEIQREGLMGCDFCFGTAFTMEEGKKVNSRERMMIHSSTGVAEILKILDFFGELTIGATGGASIWSHEKVGYQIEDFCGHV